MIKYYNTEAEYETAVKTARESQLSLVGSDNNIHIDGVNVVVGLASAKTGAACVLDEHSAMHFIAPGTFSKDSFPANYTYVGPVLIGVDHPEFRGKIILGYKYIYGKYLLDSVSYRLRNYTLDGADHEVEIGFHDPDTVKDVWYSFTYNATTVDELVSELNEFFTNVPSAGLQAQDWIAIGLDTDSDGVNDAIDIKGWRNPDHVQARIMSKVVAVSHTTLPNIEYWGSPYNVTMNGGTKLQPIGNMIRAIEYLYNDGRSTLYNPQNVVSDDYVNYTLCLPAYLGTSQYRDGDKCAAVRAVYGEGEDGWKKYLEGCKLLKPCAKGVIGDKTLGDGKTNTYIMANDAFVGRSGVMHRTSEFAYSVMNLAFNHNLLSAGNWYIPDINELSSIMQTIRYGSDDRTVDPINMTQFAAGGSAITICGRYLSTTRYGSNQVMAYLQEGLIAGAPMNTWPEYEYQYGVIIICSIEL